MTVHAPRTNHPPRPTSGASSPGIWLGFTQMASAEPIIVERAEGCYLYTTQGRRLLDGVSSMWCNVHGHRHPRLDQAIRDQLDRVAHVTTLGMCSDTTERFAIELAARCPGSLDHIFFSSDGASAVEAAIKMSLQYWRQCDHPQPQKTRYIALGRAYHGDTTGCVSLGGIDFFHSIFRPLLFEPIRGPVPCSYRLPDSVDASLAAEVYASQLESLLEAHHHTVAAVVMEPMIQGAAGMLTHPAGFLSRVRELCNAYDVLLVCDEVATGFGRTGAMFACELESVTPDLMCLGKGITGGYLPMAATVATTKIYEAFLGAPNEYRQFFHGHTYGGNPLAAAVAHASLELFDEHDLLATTRTHGRMMRERLAPLLQHPHVGDIRGHGMMIGIELVQDKATRAPLVGAGGIVSAICDRCLERDVWIRPLGDVLVLMPPLVAERHELEYLVDTVIDAVQHVPGV